MLLATSTVAVSAPENGMPVPGVERMLGFTTTMYAIVKKVVMPPMMSAYSARSRVDGGGVMRACACYHPTSLARQRTSVGSTGPHAHDQRTSPFPVADGDRRNV